MKALVVCALLALSSAAWAKGLVIDDKYELVQLNVLNRHGHRAPNAPYWTVCPNDAYNRKNYEVVSGGLTDLGFQEEYKLGQYIHSKYGKFIGSRYSPMHHYVRAVSEPRTVQSALVATQTIFPDGFGPKGMLPSRPQYVPVFGDLESHEYLLDDLQCIPQVARDVKQYMATGGAAVLNETQNAEALKELVRLCGTKPEQLAVKADVTIKVLVDGVIFNHDYGMNVLNGKISKKMFFTLRNMTNVLLQQKLYGTDEQKTYASVDFPREMLHRFKLARDHPGVLGNLKDTGVPTHNTFNKFSFYCGHREELYGISHFFDMPIRVPGYPVEELPTGSAYLFQLLRKTDGDKAADDKSEYFVKVDLWTPKNGIFTLGIKGCASPHLCSLDDMIAVYERRVERTGTWEKLCNTEIPPRDKTFK